MTWSKLIIACRGDSPPHQSIPGLVSWACKQLWALQSIPWFFSFKKIAYWDKDLNPVNKITTKKKKRKRKGEAGLTGFSNPEDCEVLERFSLVPVCLHRALTHPKDSSTASAISAGGGSQSDLERSRGSGDLPSDPEMSGIPSLIPLCLIRASPDGTVRRQPEALPQQCLWLGLAGFVHARLCVPWKGQTFIQAFL